MSIPTLIPPAAPAPRPALVEAEARRALDLAQQGFLAREIAELLDVQPESVEEALEAG